MRRNVPWAVALSALVTLGLTTTSRAAVCYLDDPGNTTPLVSPLTTGAGHQLPTLCGHEIHGSSCVLNVANDGTLSADTVCLTLGAGVTVNMNGHSIQCTANVCNSGIKITGSGSAASAKVNLNDGSVLGCFRQGLYDAEGGATGYVYVTDFTIDLTALGSGCSLTGGKGGSPANADLSGTPTQGFRSMVRVVAGNGSGTGMIMNVYGTVEDSIVHDNDTVGLNIIPSSANSLITGSLFTGNGDNIKSRWPNGYFYRLNDSTVREADSCNFRDNSGACDPATTYLDLGGINFIDNTIVQ